jgi:hypothetical protein
VNKKYLAVLILFTFTNHAHAVDFNQLYQSWSGEGLVSSNAAKGEELWSYELIPGKSCASCHGNDLSQTGSHVKTNKLIKPLSPNTNPKRLTKVSKINKWLKRNCKFTYKRECTSEEKINFIEFIRKN